LGAALVGNPSLAAMIEHHALLYDDLSDPVALLKGSLQSPKLKAFWAYAKNPDAAAAAPEAVRAYSALMAKSQAMVAHQVLDAYDLSHHRRLMDVGGGEGAFLMAAGRRHPRLELALFDLPAVAARAAQGFEAAGFGARASTFGGDFFRDALSRGADIVSLVRVLHDHDDGFALALLRQVHAALPKGGALLLAEPMSGTSGAEPAGDAYFGLYLAAMGSGRPRTFQEIAEMTRQAGFRAVREMPTATPMVTRVLVATA
jgi:demethylspheroidene O-methyltransferase